MDVAAARALVPALDDMAFLDTACVGLAPQPTVEAVEAVARMASRCDEPDASAHHVALDRLRDQALVEGAKLLGASLEEVALVESTTHGLSIAAQAIPFRPHDNVVICDLEFLQVAIPWVTLAEQGRIREVRLARNVAGAVPVEAFARVVDERTRAVVVSSVQWVHGYRVDLAGLRRLCRQCGAYLVVDAIQELGALRLDVRTTPVDILVAGGHKWLCSPFGCGLLYVAREVQDELAATSLGYLSLEEPEGGWPRYFATPEISPLRRYRFPADARRFQIGGTANYPGAAALGASLALVNAMGIDRVEAHVLGLAETLACELDRLGLEVVSPPQARSGITTFCLGPDSHANERLLQRLLDERVLVSLRYTSGVGGIRVSTHFYNDESDLERLLSVLRRLRRRRSFAPASPRPA